MNASIKDNILLGRAMREKRYQKVIKACDLAADIDLLPEGDDTEVGEKGVLLSGGQRQRLAIARCLYSKAACTFLDAPFSSLDSNITNHIFNEGILGILMKRKRTVFMATDRIDFLHKADWVIYLMNGAIKTQGSVKEVMKVSPELRINLSDSVSRGTSKTDDGLVEGKTAQERWALLKNVTRLSIFMRKVKRENCELGKESTRENLRHVMPHSKKTISNKLSRSQMRMDSSSQLNLCHDLMLPSEESNDSYSSPAERRKMALIKNQTQGINKRSLFARAQSWSTHSNVNVRPQFPPPLGMQIQKQHPSNRRLLRNSGGSSSTLIRQKAVAGPSPPNTSMPATVIPRKRAPHLGEFQRMRSFQHQVMGFKSKLSGSNNSLPKHSNSDPEGYSMDQFPVVSRSTSRQSSYGMDSSLILSTSSAAVHSRIMRMTSNTSQISGFSDDYQVGTSWFLQFAKFMIKLLRVDKKN